MVESSAGDEADNDHPLAFDLESLNGDFFGRRRGPLKRFALFSSGVNQKVLRRAAADTTLYSAIGTFVIVTACFAAVSAYVAISIRIHGTVEFDQWIAGGAALWGLLIYVVDRALVRVPLNPVRFRSEVTLALWNPSASAAGDLAVRPKNSELVRRRWTDAFGVIVTVLPRLLLAVAVSFIFAETLLLLVFQPAVSNRLESIVSNAIVQNSITAQQTYEEQRSKYVASLDSLRQQLDPELPRLQGDLPAQDADCKGYDANVSKLRSAISQEYDGTGIVVDLYPQGQWNVGVEPASQARINRLLTEIDSQESKRDSACSDFNATQGDIDRRVKDIDQNTQVVEVNNKIAALDAGVQGQQENARLAAEALRNDLIVRLTALDQVAKDQDPSTASFEDGPGCSAGDVACAIGQYFFYPSPMGPVVGAFRIAFLSIELMPIIIKIQASLRRRRPYDTLMAASETVSDGASFRLASQQLLRIGELIERDAYHRRQARTEMGAEFVAATARVESIRRRRFDWRKARSSPRGWGESIMWMLIPRDVREEDLYQGPKKSASSADPAVPPADK